MTTSPYLVYLLHFAEPIDGAQHYLGCTRADRLTLRLIEHGNGRGAKLTSKAVERGVSMHLVRTFPAEGFQTERAFKRAGHFRRLCPLCTPSLHTLPKSAYPLRQSKANRSPPGASATWAGLPSSLSVTRK